MAKPQKERKIGSSKKFEANESKCRKSRRTRLKQSEESQMRTEKGKKKNDLHPIQHLFPSYQKSYNNYDKNLDHILCNIGMPK